MNMGDCSQLRRMNVGDTCLESLVQPHHIHEVFVVCAYIFLVPSWVLSLGIFGKMVHLLEWQDLRRAAPTEGWCCSNHIQLEDEDVAFFNKSL